MAERLCRNDGRMFAPAHWNDRYCSPGCRQAARRKRDRVRKQMRAKHVTKPAMRKGERGSYAAQPAGIPNELKDVYGKCRQCGGLRPLRFDTYGPADDAYLDAEPEFCSPQCVVDWWKAQPGKPDICLEIKSMLGAWDASKAKACREGEDDYVFDLL